MFATIGAGALLIIASVPALATRPARAGSANADPVWARWDPSTKTASLTITAAYNQVGSGFNFDGYNNGGLTISEARRLRGLEQENRRLKQIVADLTLDNRALKEINSKNW